MTLTIEEINDLLERKDKQAESDEDMCDVSKAAFRYGAAWMLNQIHKLLANKTIINEEQDGQQDL